ncbi:MAG: hypothetical protein K9K67_13475 [Bacteriovoracaceae bacterium]|nr:hypothetical protein [Bacteriovoracaceae bacterium]
MVVQFILKGLFFYFLFLFVRSFIKGASGAKNVKENNTHQTNGFKSSSSKREDVVEADFRRL